MLMQRFIARCTQNMSDPCCSSANNCQTWVGCGDDTACKTVVREVIEEEADIITQCGEEIRQRAALRPYQDIVTFFAGQYGHVTGAFFPGYDTTRADATRPDMRYPIPPLTSGKLSGEIAPGQAAAIPDAYWESEPSSDVDAILELVLTLQDDDGIQQSVAVKRVVVSRELRQHAPSNPPTTWDDVTMLQMVLRSLGMSQTEKPGYLGDVVLTGKFEASGTTSCTNLALGRFEYVDELIGIQPTPALARQWCTGDGSPVLPVTTTVLQKLFAHWTDYLAALEAYPQFRIIKAEIDQLQTVYSPDTLQAYQTAYQQWLLAGAGELSATYSDEQVRLVEGLTKITHAQANESRARLLDAWIRKETQDHGHWGDQTPYRITVGGHDETGSMGFSQIQNWYRYGEGKKANALSTLNLYLPEQATRGFAIWSNSNEENMGKGFYKAFSTDQYAHPEPYAASIYPKLSNIHFTNGVYKDDYKAADRLAKGLAAYKRLNNDMLYDETWPEILRNHPKTGGGIPKELIEYALEIKTNAGLPLRTWTWVLNQDGKTGDYGESDWNEKTFQQKLQECEQDN